MSEYEQGKPLATPVILKTEPQELAKATFAMAQQCGLVNHVSALVLTQQHQPLEEGLVLFELERLLGKKLLMLAGRDHVFERILCAVHKELFGVSSGPDDTHKLNTLHKLSRQRLEQCCQYQYQQEFKKTADQ